VEEARDPNDPELYDVIIGNVGELEIIVIQSCMMLSLVMWRELEIIVIMITSYNSGSL
jgi:hypothetical protein